MAIIYSIAIRGYGIFILLASIFNPKAKEWLRGRKRQRWAEVPAGRQLVWFHCASLGEFDQGLPLMEEWRSRFSDTYILVTFFSPSGMLHHHKRNHPADQVVYLDLDTRSNAKRFVQHFRPSIVFFVKYEFWRRHIEEAKRSGTRIYSISTILRPEQIYFRSYGGYFANTLRMFDHFFVQNERTQELLTSLQILNASVTGDNRFDRVVANANRIKENELIQNFKGSDPIFIIGSSWPIDDKILIPFVNSIEWKVIIAPHQISEGYINSIEEQISRKCVRYTQMDQHSSTNEIIILDTIGQLSSAYAYGDIAYVGGGFTGKLHNILEPAVFGLPILIGPKHKRFPEASQFIADGVAFEVRSIENLRDKFQTVAMQRNEIQSKARELVAANTGASKRIIDLLIASSTI